jgi:Tol biopolymer transport system component
VYDIADARSGGVDIWAFELPDGTPSRLTSDPAVDFYVACSPSGADVVFASLRQGVPSLYRLNTSAPGSEQPLQKMPGTSIPSDWSPDGKSIVVSTFSPKTNWDIWMVPVAGGQPTPFAQTGVAERNGRLSPDGRWMAYSMDQGSGVDIWVQAVPPTRVKWQISQGGGGQAVWHPNGRQLFYLSPKKQIIAVDVNTSGPTFATGASRVLIEARVAGWERSGNGAPYAITADGERFLVSNAAESAQPITLIFNWPLKLSAR